MSNPKAFISYSWSNDLHQQWVVSLATQLRESGVDVILDKWDLREGNDAIAFMEKMVTDEEIKKVIVILDRVYAEKANGRQGGVGTETQIITPQIYKSVDQNKFVGVISEVDADGKPFLPAFYSSRIYIDLSNDDLFATNFDQLLRWIYDQPAFPKPAMGRKPEFLNEQTVLLPTRAKANRAIGLLRTNSTGNSGALQDYLDAFVENAEALRLQPSDNVQFDDLVVNAIEAIRPYRDEFCGVMNALAKGAPTDQNIALVKRFFEQMIPLMFRPDNLHHWQDQWFDNYRFIVHEFLLYFVATLIKQELFSNVNEFLSGDFYVGGVTSLSNEPLRSITILQSGMQSLDIRNGRLGLNRMSLRADLIKERVPATGITLNDLMQADLVIFLRDGADCLKAETHNRWNPITLVWAERRRDPFEIFARAVSRKYFQRILPMFGLENREEFLSLLTEFGKKLYLPRWNYWPLELNEIIQPSRLATRP